MGLKPARRKKQILLTNNQKGAVTLLLRGYQFLWHPNQDNVYLAEPEGERDKWVHVQPVTLHSMYEKGLLKRSGKQEYLDIYILKNADELMGHALEAETTEIIAMLENFKSVYMKKINNYGK